MAGRSVLELAVGTGKWDSGLKKAQSALNNFVSAQGGLQQALDKENEKIGKFVQMMGKTGSTASTMKGQMNDYKSTIEQLTVAYNRMTDAQKASIGKDYLNAIDSLKQKYQEAKQAADHFNRSLNETSNAKMPDVSGGGGLFGGGRLNGMLQVFGGNVMTRVAGMAASFVGQMGDVIGQSIEISKATEGIELAFNRLNRPDLLDKLRDATHNTVSDIELMKASVKFNDFKLPLDQLGTMLAFAQQKAKDTGESIDYMVESITNGLGRQSKPILDNLGISAKEIEERMKSTGDFTKAVGEIIRDQMSKAGEYVETEADRAAQANTKVQNAMKDLGDAIQKTFGYSGIDDMVNGLKTELIPVLTDVINLMGELKESWVGESLTWYFGKLSDTISYAWSRLKNLIDLLVRPNIASGGVQIGGILGQTVVNQNTTQTPVITGGGSGGSGNKTKTAKAAKTIKAEKDPFTEIIGLIPNAEEYVKDLQKQIRESWDEGEIANLTHDLEDAEKELERLKKIGKIDFEEFFPMNEQKGSTQSPGQKLADELMANFAQGIQDADVNTLRNLLQVTIENGIQGIDIPTDALMEQIFGEGMNIPDEYWIQLQEQINEKLKELGLNPIEINLSSGDVNKKAKTANPYLHETADGKLYAKMNEVLGGLAGGMSQIVGSIENLGVELPQGLKDVISGIQNISTILTGIATTILAIEAISTADFFKPFKHGGIVHAASGFMVPGHDFSDATPVLASSGELILNKAQQNSIASLIDDNSRRGGDYVGKLDVETIYFGLNHYGMRTGKGELAFVKR